MIVDTATEASLSSMFLTGLNCRGKQWKSSTIRNYRTEFHRFFVTLGLESDSTSHDALDFWQAITHEEMRSYFDGLKDQGYAPNSIFRTWAFFRSFFGWCCFQYILESNPMKEIKIAKPEIQSSVIAAEKIKKVLDAPQGDHLIACRDRVVLSLIYEGFNSGHVADLRLTGVDLKSNKKEVAFGPNQGSDTDRKMPVSDETWQRLVSYVTKLELVIAEHSSKKWMGKLFFHYRGQTFNEGLSQRNICRLVKKYGQKALDADLNTRVIRRSALLTRFPDASPKNLKKLFNSLTRL